MTIPLTASAFVAGLVLLGAVRIKAQETSVNARGQLEEEAVTLEKFVVTGSAIPVAKGQQFQPLTAYTTADFAEMGASTVPEVLRTTPAFFGDVTTEQRSNGGTGSAGVNFRGMGGVLALLDGHRTAAFDEVNLVPLIALERIEIVKDSAGARYGADALTGVVNLMLVPRFRGQRMEAYYGNTTDEDAGALRVGMLAGEGNARTEVVVAAEYYHRNSLMAADREVSASSDGRSLGGQNTGSAFPSARSYGQRTPGGPVEVVALAPGVSAAFTASDYVVFDTNANTSTQFQNTRAYTPSIPEQEGKSAYARLNQQIIGNGVLDGFMRLLYSHNEYDSAVVSTVTSLSGATVAASPHVPTGFTPALVTTSATSTYLRFDSLRRGRRYERDGYDFQAGLKGRIGQTWSWDATYVYGWWYRDDMQTGGVAAAPLVAALLNGSYNPFASDWASGVNPNNGRRFDNPAVLRGAAVTGRIDRDFGVRGFDSRVSGAVLELPAGEWEIAAGLDRFITEQSVVPDAIITGSYIGFNTAGFSVAESESQGAFVETIVPVIGAAQRVPGIKSLSMMAAMRWSEKEISGTTPGNGSTILARTFREQTPKFGVRYQPVNDLSLQGTYAEGFRTPGLSSVFSALSTFSPNLRDPLGFGLSPSRVITTQGNPELEPEKSTSWSAGAIYTPKAVRGISFEATYYSSEVTNLVGEGAQYILNVNAQTQGAGFTAGAPASINPQAAFANRIARNTAGQITGITSTTFNIAARETTGVEYAISYEWPKIGGNQFRSRLEANTTLSWDLTPLKGQPSQNWLGRYVDISTNSISPGSIPRHRGRFVQSWQNGAWSASGTVKYVSHLEDDVLWTYLSRPRTISSWTTFDARVGYTWRLRASSRDTLRLDFGVSNLLDEEAPYAAAAVNDGYDVTLHSNRGRFVYVQLTKAF